METGLAATSIETEDNIVRINGRQAYWFSPSQGVAWNSLYLWSLASDQVDRLVREAPRYNADTAPQSKPLTGSAAERYNDLYNEGGDGFLPNVTSQGQRP